MARGTRSRASRAERRQQKERSANAVVHGLPAPLPPLKRVSATSTQPSSNPPVKGRSPALANPRMPLAVKLLGLGLGLLGLVYGLTLFRDHKSGSEPARPAVIAPNAVK